MAERIDGALYAETMGEPAAPPMVFLHPNPMDSACWLFQMAHLSTWFRCIAVDLPGYGRSPCAADNVTMTDIADACWEAVDEVSDQAAIIVGCSVGAAVAQHMYHRRATATRAVVLSGMGYGEPKSFVPERIGHYESKGLAYRHEYALELFSPAFRETELARWFADLFAERNGWADLSTIIAMFRALGVPDPEWLQRDLEAPVLILTGTEDRAHQRAYALRDRLPDVELVALEGAGHACHAEQPWVFDRELLGFLDRRGLLPDGPPPQGA